MATFTGTLGNDTLVGSTGADLFLPRLGWDSVSGGLGYDSLNLDYSTLSGVAGAIRPDASGLGFTGSIGSVSVPAAATIQFDGVESLAVVLSAGADILDFNAAPLAEGANVRLDGGAGFDLLRADFSALAGTTFLMGVNFLIDSNRGAYFGWEQFAIKLGAGDNRVATQAGDDRIWAGTGSNIVNSGGGNDTIWSSGGIDRIDGGAGVDSWVGDYSAASASMEFWYDTEQGAGYLSNGTTLSRIEGGSLVTGSGDDSYLLFGLGKFQIDGGIGTDLLTWDDTGDYGMPYDAAFLSDGHGAFTGSIANASFAGFERINVALGDGDNAAWVDLAPLAAGATINLSGGLGWDTLLADFSAFTDTRFAVSDTGEVSASRGTWLGFEQFGIAVGQGRNTVVTGLGDDTIWSAGGQDTIDGGPGRDAWSGDYTATMAALTFSWNGTAGTGMLSNGTNLTSIESGVLFGGSGNDTFQLSGLLPFDVVGGPGVDTLVRNDAGLLGAGADTVILSTGTAFRGWAGNGAFDDIERLTLTLGEEDDKVWIDAAPLSAAAALSVDGGGGVNRLALDLSALPGATFTVDPNGTVVSNRGAYRKFASYWLAIGSGSNTITTGSGNDTVDASTAAGANTITTGDGDDEIVGGPGGEVVLGGAGADTFRIGGRLAGYLIARDGSGGYTITDIDPADGVDAVDRLTNVEQVVFTDGTVALPAYGTGITRQGTSSADTLAGTSFDDRLSGLAGDDTLAGGDGNDWLSGGAGNDRIAGGSGVDTLDYSDATAAIKVNLGVIGKGQATGGSGSDWLVDYLENLVGSGSADTLTGNASANRISGGAGNDTLDGGIGADTLVGSTGDDVFYVDDAGDVTAENAGEGTDLVRATITWTLATNTEKLQLYGISAIDGTGNAAANGIIGNAAANRLLGLDGSDTLDGGAGADTLSGGLGNDSYVVDDPGDTVIELANEGTDTVTARVSWVLPANVENLVLGGTAAISGGGNALANAVTGNAANNLMQGFGGNDTLSGGSGDDTLAGGFGLDVLTGGAGADTFLFDVRDTSANRDSIKDFAPGVDHIAFDRSVFAALGGTVGSALDSAAFTLGTVATTAQHHVLYNAATGSLYYDPDGAGGTAPTLIAALSTKPVLHAADFLVL